MSSKIAVIGGTGNLGSALAWRLARAGHAVVIGSRTAESAVAKAEELGHGLTGMMNADAAEAADVVFVTVPFAAQASTLEDIKPHVAGKIVVDTTVPLVPPKVMRVQLPPEGSAAAKADAILGEGVRMVAGFHNVAAHKLAQDIEVDCDILIFGDEKAARTEIVALADGIGLRGVHGGALVNAAAADNKALLNDLLCMLVSCFIFKKYDTILNLSLLKVPCLKGRACLQIFSFSTRLLRTPILDTSISTRSPSFIQTGGLRRAPTPPGVPLTITSPGANVVKVETYSIKRGIGKINMAVVACCIT